MFHFLPLQPYVSSGFCNRFNPIGNGEPPLPGSGKTNGNDATPSAIATRRLWLPDREAFDRRPPQRCSAISLEDRAAQPPKRQLESKSAARTRSRLVAELMARRRRRPTNTSQVSRSGRLPDEEPSPDRPHNVQRIGLCNFGRQACGSSGRASAFDNASPANHPQPSRSRPCRLAQTIGLLHQFDTG